MVSITSLNTTDKLSDSRAVINTNFDNLNEVMSSKVRAYLSASVQTIGTGATTKIEFNAESYDGRNEYDPTTNYRFTAQKAGYYQVSAQIRWNSTTDTLGHLIYIYKNNAQITQNLVRSSGTNWFMQSISDIVQLAVDDYIEIFCNQGSGGDISLQHGSRFTFLTIHQLS